MPTLGKRAGRKIYLDAGRELAPLCGWAPRRLAYFRPVAHVPVQHPDQSVDRDETFRLVFWRHTPGPIAFDRSSEFATDPNGATVHSGLQSEPRYRVGLMQKKTDKKLNITKSWYEDHHDCGIRATGYFKPEK